jgi:hypothetical protein
MAETAYSNICSLKGCFSLTLQKEYMLSVWSRRWMTRYCSKEHWKLAKKFAWKSTFSFTIKLIKFIVMLIWKIIYGIGIVLVYTLFAIGTLMFWIMVFDAIEDILNPTKKNAC